MRFTVFSERLDRIAKGQDRQHFQFTVDSQQWAVKTIDWIARLASETEKRDFSVSTTTTLSTIPTE